MTVGVIRTIMLEHAFEAQLFANGKVPDPLPYGFYKGNISILGYQWLGKKFDRGSAKGINVFFHDGNTFDSFPFITYVDKEVKDSSIAVLRIDYDMPNNPLWVRPVLDEIVEVGTGKYLGKAYIRIIPFYPFLVTYFWLEK